MTGIEIGEICFQMSKKTVVIIGAGRFGAETLELARQIANQTTEFDILGFFDDSIKVTEVSGFPVLGGVKDVQEVLEAHSNMEAVVAIGNPMIKKNVVKRYESTGLSFTNLVHPQAIVPESVKLGRGCIITAGCILTVDIEIGNHVILNLGTTVGHDVTIGEFATINPQVALNGRNTIGEGVYIGTGAKLVDEVSIGDWSLIGAGAVVTKSIPPGVLAVGVPAKPIKKSPFIKNQS